MSKRRGFSLIELLVVIAIIGILAGLLMSAVQRVRESGNRTKCVNNMKQITLALVQLEQKQGSYPPNSVTSTANPAQPTMGTMIHLMPFLEQDPVFKNYNFSKNWNDPLQDQPTLQFQPAFFQCPSNPSPNQRSPEGYGICDYAAVKYIETKTPSANSLGLYPGLPGGPSPRSYSKDTKTGDGRGLMNVVDGNNTLARVKIDDVKDGVSNTIAFAEDVGRPVQYNANRIASGLISGGGSAWADASHPITFIGATSVSTPTGCANCDDNSSQIYSFHNAGVVLGFADGSVRTTARLTDPVIMAALVTRAGGETVSPDF
jgi:prepilin-type N-terminal cleavage/methylation domain-containing protein